MTNTDNLERKKEKESKNNNNNTFSHREKKIVAWEIRTPAGEPNGLAVHRLNHSAKATLADHSF